MTRIQAALLTALGLAAAACASSQPTNAAPVNAPATSPKSPATGTKPVLDPGGVPIDCPILEGGLCYQTLADAAAARGADPAACSVLEIYPGQLACKSELECPFIGPDGACIDDWEAACSAYGCAKDLCSCTEATWRNTCGCRES